MTDSLNAGGQVARRDRLVEEYLVISATDAHLPRQIGEALKDVHHGNWTFTGQPDEVLIPGARPGL